MKEKIDILNRGELPIWELGLLELIQRNVKLGRLHFSTDLKEAVDRSLVVFLAVGTPERDDGYADLSQIEAVILRGVHYDRAALDAVLADLER